MEQPKSIDFREIRINGLKRDMKRVEIELSMTTGFFKKRELKSDLKMYKKELARQEREKMIDDILEEMESQDKLHKRIG
jgi:hypothetical protein